jgi:hypothetical protein
LKALLCPSPQELKTVKTQHEFAKILRLDRKIALLATIFIFILFDDSSHGMLIKKGHQLNRPSKRLLRQVENPTRLLPHIIVSRNAVINTGAYLLFLFNF